jgi:hypothetical protein
LLGATAPQQLVADFDDDGRLLALR